MITIKHKGNFNNLERFLSKAKKIKFEHILHKYGLKGINALAAATPVDTGLTAQSWEYSIEVNKYGYAINFHNSNVNNGIPVVILIQYGHGTRTGGYIPPRDFINPTLEPIFKGLADEISAEVSSL